MLGWVGLDCVVSCCVELFGVLVDHLSSLTYARNQMRQPVAPFL